MATITFKNIVKDMTTGTDTYYTCPSSTTAIISGLTVANFHASSSSNATVYINDTSGAKDGYFLKSVSIGTGLALTLPNMILEAGDTVKGTAGANSVFTITGGVLERS
jgi:hypothetical protein